MHNLTRLVDSHTLHLPIYGQFGRERERSRVSFNKRLKTQKWLYLQASENDPPLLATNSAHVDTPVEVAQLSPPPFGAVVHAVPAQYPQSVVSNIALWELKNCVGEHVLESRRHDYQQEKAKVKADIKSTAMRVELTWKGTAPQAVPRLLAEALRR